MQLANQAAYTNYWTAGPLPRKHLCLMASINAFDMDSKIEIAAEITQN